MTNIKINRKFYPGSYCYHLTIKELNNLRVQQLTKKGIVHCYQDSKEYTFPVSQLASYPET